MNIAGWCMMAFSITAILTLFTFCIAKVLSSPMPEDDEES